MVGFGVYAVMKFGDKLDMLLSAKGWSQAKLASAIGVATSAVSEMTRGKRRPYMDQAQAIARVFGVPLDYLADDALDAPAPAAPALTDAERIVLDLAHEIGFRETVRMLTLMSEDMKRQLPGRVAPALNPRTGEPLGRPGEGERKSGA